MGKQIVKTRHFAILPVFIDGEMVWFKAVWKITDYRPKNYLGLLPEVTYQKI